eukprot:scaffold204098_cov31-Prasinocladus_malaysianus.AAC.1
MAGVAFYLLLLLLILLLAVPSSCSRAQTFKTKKELSARSRLSQEGNAEQSNDRIIAQDSQIEDNRLIRREDIMPNSGHRHD